MQINCSTITFAALPLDAALDRIVDAGFASVEIGAAGVYGPHFAALPGDDAGRRAVVDAVLVRGLTVTAVNAVPFLLATSDDVAARMRATDEVLRLARDLGSAVILSDLPRGDDAGAARRRAAVELRAAFLLGRDGYGVEVSVEAPHRGLSAASMEEAVELLDMIDLPAMGIAYDASHVTAAGCDARGSLRLLGDRIRHVHARDARGTDNHFTPGEGDYEWPVLVEHLVQTGHRRGMTVELEFSTRAMNADALVAEAVRARDFLSRLIR